LVSIMMEQQALALESVNVERRRSVSAEENKQLMRRFIEEWNKGDTQAPDVLIEETVDSDFVNHDAVGPGEGRGPEGVKKMFGAFRVAFPDGRTTIEDAISEGDTLVTRWTFRGTHEGEFGGIEPTGTRVTLRGINIDQIKGGKFVERWYQSDGLGLMRQLGVI
jgi:predicted ester cyclase